MKKKIMLATSLLIAVIAMLSPVSAATPYKTYTYSYSGDVQISPAAYSAEMRRTEFGDAGALNNPGDVYFDKYSKHIIISDTGNNRIIITDTEFNLLKIISQFGNDSFNEPSGTFVSYDGYLYVADTKNKRIVIFDSDYNFFKELPAISSDILPDGFSYNPIGVAVDHAKNVYVVSENSNMGVISLDPNGNFEGFIGAQAATVNPLESFWRSFMSEEQLSRSESYVSVEYSNLTIDSKGFVYVTCSDIDRFKLYSAVNSRSTDSTYAPIKKINPAGTDVLVRNGFFPPVGDIHFDAYKSDDMVNPSQLKDVELLDNGMYVLLDSSQNKLFVYDSAGDLLYAFGGTGEAEGLYSSLCAVAYGNDRLYTLDSQTGSITVLKPTEYGNLISKVMGYQENRDFEAANELWHDVLAENNNCDIAYLGLGKIEYENGNYKQAMNYFKLIGNKTYYAKAFKLYRETILDKVGMVIFAAVVIVILLIVKLIGKTAKYNNRLTEHPHTGKLKDELIYGFYVARHPFNGNWGLKAEKRGSMRGATIWLAITAVSSLINTLGACYLQKAEHPTVISALSNTVIPLLLIVVANMCFTSLMDGKGSFKDVYITVCYSTVPYAITTIPFTLIGYTLVNDELSILSLASSLILAWVIMLIFFGLMTVHDYSFGKNLLVTLLTIAGIGFILFILMIFVSLTGKMITLVTSIINELSFRA